MENKVYKRLREHYEEALKLFPEDRIVGIFLQGSQNYGLDTPASDVDTRLIVVPSFKEIAFNQKSVSTTHIMDNGEHMDIKDIRDYLKLCDKQNPNTIEILFTEYKIVNPKYEEEWNKLVEGRNNIANLNPNKIVKTMRGIAYERRKRLETGGSPETEAKVKEYGYDNKKLYHLLRVEDFLKKYIAGEKYENCLRASDPEALKWEKTHFRPLDEACLLADETMARIDEMVDTFFESAEDKCNGVGAHLLVQARLNFTRIALKEEVNS